MRDGHESTMAKIILKARTKLQEKFNIAKVEKKELPDEAILLTVTETLVVWGTEFQRETAKKKWIKAQSVRLSGVSASDLRLTGQCHVIKQGERSLTHRGAELHTLMECMDVHLNKAPKEDLAKAIEEQKNGT